MWELSELKTMMHDCKILAGDLNVSVKELEFAELSHFKRGIEYLLGEYFTAPDLKAFKEIETYRPRGAPKDIEVYKLLLHLDEKLSQIYRELVRIKENLLGRGYPRIYSILKRNVATYLLGAMMAKDYYNGRFSGVMQVPGEIYMTFLRKEDFTDEDLGCLSGFICRNKPKENMVRFIANAKEWKQEVVWVKDNDLYVCSIPYTIILRPRDYHDFNEVEELLGVAYKFIR